MSKQLHCSFHAVVEMAARVELFYRNQNRMFYAMETQWNDNKILCSFIVHRTDMEYIGNAQINS